jgi:addiction module RelE/StbE family toxin
VRVRYRQRALADIEKIHEYISERNPRAATEIAARIRGAAERLVLWPFMGHIGRARGTYEWAIVGSPYVIVYEIVEAAEEIAIIAVFHGAQDREGGVP